MRIQTLCERGLAVKAIRRADVRHSKRKKTAAWTRCENLWTADEKFFKVWFVCTNIRGRDCSKK